MLTSSWHKYTHCHSLYYPVYFSFLAHSLPSKSPYILIVMDCPGFKKYVVPYILILFSHLPSICVVQSCPISSSPIHPCTHIYLFPLAFVHSHPISTLDVLARPTFPLDGKPGYRYASSFWRTRLSNSWLGDGQVWCHEGFSINLFL